MKKLIVVVITLLVSCTALTAQHKNKKQPKKVLTAARDSIVAPPGIIDDLIEPEKDTQNIFNVVDNPAKYNGSFTSFLQNNLRYPPEAQAYGIEGKVLVSFIVCEDGKLCEVKAQNGDTLLKEEAIRVIANSGNWIPATIRDVKVKSRFQQVIYFKLSE